MSFCPQNKLHTNSSFCFCFLELASFRKAEILVLSDNDVIEDPDRDRLAGGLDLLGDLVILAAGFDFPGWVVMLCGVLSYVE